MAQQLRAAMDARPPELLQFLTLTRPRRYGESAADAWAAWQSAWEQLRHTPAWRQHVVGGVRTVEVTWSMGHAQARTRVPGWHVHGHVLVELHAASMSPAPCGTCSGSGRYRHRHCRSCSSATHRGGGLQAAGSAALLRAWAAIVAGSPAAQCAVPIDPVNVGQLAKYLTKLWDLPTERARELFGAAAGKRITEGFGAWRSWRRWGGVESTPHGWVACGLTLAEIERMPRARRIAFEKPLPITLEPLRDAVASLQQLNPAAAGATRGLLTPGAIDTYGTADYVEPDAATGARAPPRPQRATRSPAWRPTTIVAEVSAGRILDALRRDDRPVWERVTEKPPDHGERCAAASRIVHERAVGARTLGPAWSSVAAAAEPARSEHRGHVHHAVRFPWEH